jgi:MFS family permease
MGRYQICIWFLCGFGYFLDLAWSQGVGLIATAVYQEMDVPDARTGDIWSLANAGLAVGALTFGLLVDVIGRKWAFNLTCLITSVFGLLIVGVPIYPQPCNVTNAFPLFLSNRLLQSTTTKPFAGFTSWLPSDWEATSPSTRPSLWNSCPRAAGTS